MNSSTSDHQQQQHDEPSMTATMALKDGTNATPNIFNASFADLVSMVSNLKAPPPKPLLPPLPKLKIDGTMKIDAWIDGIFIPKGTPLSLNHQIKPAKAPEPDGIMKCDFWADGELIPAGTLVTHCKVDYYLIDLPDDTQRIFEVVSYPKQARGQAALEELREKALKAEVDEGKRIWKMMKERREREARLKENKLLEGGEGSDGGE